MIGVESDIGRNSRYRSITPLPCFNLETIAFIDIFHSNQIRVIVDWQVQL
jgi:hypothetical protein